MQDLALNLGATLVGIPITVLVVEKLLDMEDRRRWAAVHAVVSHYVEKIGNGAITHYRTALGIPDDAVEPGTASEDDRERHNAMIEFAEGAVLNALDNIDGMDRQDWRQLLNDLDGVDREAQLALSMFAGRMGPEQQARILRLRRAIDSVGSTYGIYQPILGVRNGIVRVEAGSQLERLLSRMGARHPDADPVTLIHAAHQTAIEVAKDDARKVLRAAVELLRVA